MVVESVALRLIGCRVTLHLQPTSHFDASLIIFVSHTRTRRHTDTCTQRHTVISPLQMCGWLVLPGVQITFPQTKPAERTTKWKLLGLIMAACFVSLLFFLFSSFIPPLPLVYIPGCFCPFVSFTPFVLLHPPDGLGSCKYLIQAKASSSLHPHTPHLRHLITALLHTYFTAWGDRERDT